MSFRLLALDLDGTLLDPFGALTPSVRRAVAAAGRHGLEVVVCTGRRFRTALPFLHELGLGGAVVVNNGAVVKEIASGRSTFRAVVPRPLYPEALELLREHGPPLVYLDAYPDGADFLTDRRGERHPYQAGYLEDHADHCRVVDDLADALRDDVIMLSAMADLPRLEALRERARARLGARIGTHLIVNKNYEGHILELVSPESGKWPALCRVAAAAGVAAEEIAAVGDDSNDTELLRGAGLGIAMGNAVPETLAAADVVVASNAEGGAAEAIERVLLAR